MYRELQPFREALSRELKASLFPAVAGVDASKLLETYLDRLTMYTGVDVAAFVWFTVSLPASRRVASLSRYSPASRQKVVLVLVTLRLSPEK